MILKDCSTCLVYGEDEELLMKARVVSVEEKIILYFDDIVNLVPEVETKLKMDFFDSQMGCIKTISRIVIFKNEDPWVTEKWAAECAVLEVIETLQRQKDLRVKLEEELRFTSTRHGRFKGMIYNISVGGIMLFTETPLDVHEEISFRCCFLKREHDIRAIILREQPMQKEYHVYGCQFLHLTNSAEKDIRQFVFRQQLKRIN